MRLTLIGKDPSSAQGNSPTLYSTDRDSYVVQGWRVPGASDTVEIPHELLGFLVGRPGLATALHDTGRDSYLLTGDPVNDAEALAQMCIPDNETCVEVRCDRQGEANAAITR